MNKCLYKEKYEEEYKTWNKRTREEKAKLVMTFVDNIELELKNGYVNVKNINFRESIAKPCNDLYTNGYIDRMEECFFGSFAGQIRCSRYLNEEEAAGVIMRLKNYYKVSYKEATYYVKDKVMYFDYLTNNSAIIRIFPLEDYSKYEDPSKIEEYKMGIIYINGNDIKVLKDEKDINKLFNYIPSDSMSEYDINNELKDIQIKPIKSNILENN